MYIRLGWLVGLACCSVAAGAEWSVDDDLADNPDADFMTIQEAVDAAANVDIIHVYPGTYTSNADAVVTLSDKYLVLLATEGADQTIIDGQNLRRGVVVEAGSNGIFMVGFTITQCRTPDSPNSSRGAAILASSALVELYGCNIVSNSATGGYWSSAAIYCTDSDLVLEDCSLSANVANSGAAGIWALDSNVTCRRCSFTNHQSIDGPEGNGDVIYVEGVTADGPPSLVLSQCSVTSNASTSGLGIVSCYLGDVECSFTEFRSNSGARIFYMYLATSGTIEDCVFDSNTAESNGGGMEIVGDIYSADEIPVEITNCEFLGNQSEGRGGGLRVLNAMVTMSGCEFLGNQAEDRGGGLGMQYAMVTMSGCEFLGNQSELSGGGLSFTEATVTMSGCQFQSNTAGSVGGGMRIDNAHSIEITDTTFLANTAVGESGSAASFANIELTPSLVRVEACGNTPSWSQISGDWSDEGDVCIMTICDPIPDGRIDVHDLLTVLEWYGESCEDCTDLQFVDLNGDLVVDLLDIEALIADWGDTCAL